MALQLADTPDILGNSAVDLRMQTLAVEQAIARDVAVARQLAQPLKLLIQRRALQNLACLGGPRAAQLRFKAGDSFTQARLFGSQCLGTTVE